jgi:hypothetical protein
MALSNPSIATIKVGYAGYRNRGLRDCAPASSRSWILIDPGNKPG